MATPASIKFISDGVIVKERESDHSYKAQFSVGEYHQAEMAKLMMIPKENNLRITVEVIE